MKKFGLNMDRVLKLGQTEQSMKDNGKMIKFKGKEGLVMLMVIYMKVNLLQVKQMVQVYTLRKEEKYMKEH